MQAITVKFLGPTNSRGPRYKATCAAGSLTSTYEHGGGAEEAKQHACRALVKKLGWDTYPGRWVSGTIKNGEEVFVFVSSRPGGVNNE